MASFRVFVRRSLAAAAAASFLVAIMVCAAQAAPRSALIQSGYDPAQGISGATFYTTVGWEFTPQADIWVTDLGFFDLGQNGLNISHDIGIWDQDHQLIVSATVPGGTAAQLIGEYRYAPVAPVLLMAGHTFVIGATVPLPLMDPPPFSPDYYPSGTGDVNPDATVLDPTIVMIVADRCARIDLSQELAFPSEHYEPRAPVFLDPDTGEQIGPIDLDAYFVAPNFIFVPEPTALSLLVVGSLMLLRRR
jgi:hypothetical protein